MVFYIISYLFSTKISNKEVMIGGYLDKYLSTENVTKDRALISFLLHEQHSSITSGYIGVGTTTLKTVSQNITCSYCKYYHCTCPVSTDRNNLIYLLVMHFINTLWGICYFVYSLHHFIKTFQLFYVTEAACPLGGQFPFEPPPSLFGPIKNISYIFGNLSPYLTITELLFHVFPRNG
jgi:hypothetical protein